MREGKTLTRTMQIESRQHELFNLDLGEGAPRAALVAGFVLIVTWFALLTAILGPPSRGTFMLYLLPPAVVTVFGWRESQRNPRRRRITDWALCARWLWRGHDPIISLGRTRTKGHVRSLRRRVSERLATNVDGRTGHRQPARHALDAPLPEVAIGDRIHLIGTRAAEQMLDRKSRTQRMRARLTKGGRS